MGTVKGETTPIYDALKAEFEAKEEPAQQPVAKASPKRRPHPKYVDPPKRS